MSEVRGARRGNVVVLTVDGPASRNALGRATFGALERHLETIAHDGSARAVVLTGAGAVFVSGGDLRELRGQNSVEDATWLCDAGRAITCRIAALPIPVLAAIDGPAFGGGAELAVACDLRVAGPAAQICFKHVRLGVTTAWGTLPRLIELVGMGAATRLLLTATPVHAEEALRLGLVDAVAPRALDAALGWAAEIESGAQGAVRAMKKLLRHPAATSTVSEAERQAFVETWTAPEHAAAVESFFARRPPT